MLDLQLGATPDVPANVRTMDIDFGRPLQLVDGIRVSSGWEDGRGRAHGLDIPVPIGTPVLAIQSGVVTTADADPEGDAGKWIAIQHAHGWMSRSLHLSKLFVTKGAFVHKGQIIGLSGHTGNSAVPHLHIDLKLAPEWIPLLEREVGRPTTGYFTLHEGRYIVPTEPWIPVDSYRDDVIALAKKHRVPLYHERKRVAAETTAHASSGMLWAAGGLAALGLGLGTFFLLSTPPVRGTGRRRRWGI